jgi:hypothetical protein
MSRHMRSMVWQAVALLAVATPAAAQEESNACFSLHSSGAGATFMRICISDHGTLTRFESPAGFEQIRQLNFFRDGYAVCSNAAGGGPTLTHGWDVGNSESAWGPLVIAQPNGANTFPLSITRTTSDNMFVVKQTFARDSAEHDVTITVKVTNRSTTPREHVRFSRYFENDVDNNDAASFMSRGADSVWGWLETGHGLMLTALTFATPHSTQVEHLAFFAPPGSATGCAAVAPVATPVAAANSHAGRNTYDFGTIGKGLSKTAKYLYRRF